MSEAKTDPKSIKNRCQKRWNLEGLLEGHNLETSSILVPTWLHVGLPKSKIFRFLEVPRGLQHLIIFCMNCLSILGPSWPPTWVLFGSQDCSKSEKMNPKNLDGASPRALLIRCSFRTSFKTVLASILGGSGLDFRRFLDDLFSFLAYFGHVFACSCWGGYAPPGPPALDLVSVVLGQVFSQRCQENPRTCRS